MALHIESGHPIMGDDQRITGNKVRFVTDDGRTMFEIGIASNGKSIEVRGVETTKHNGEIYDCWLLIQPQSANSVIVSTVKYEDK